MEEVFTMVIRNLLLRLHWLSVVLMLLISRIRLFRWLLDLPFCRCGFENSWMMRRVKLEEDAMLFTRLTHLGHVDNSQRYVMTL